MRQRTHSRLRATPLNVVEFTDYVQPNTALVDGDLDANYFQHIPYLENFNEEQGTHLVNAGGIHYEPFGIYPGTKSSLDDIAEGDTIAVPNDTTNEARALLLLQDKRYSQAQGRRGSDRNGSGH